MLKKKKICFRFWKIEGSVRQDLEPAYKHTEEVHNSGDW